MSSLKLLIVEDDIASLELIAEVFRSLTAEVHPVSDSERAADILRRKWPSIVVRDTSDWE